MDSLLIGAVTIASMSPFNASSTAISIDFIDALPALMETLPGVRSFILNSVGSITDKAFLSPNSSFALSITLLLPINTISHLFITDSSKQALIATSGPIPLGSPMVIPIFGLLVIFKE